MVSKDDVAKARSSEGKSVAPMVVAPLRGPLRAADARFASSCAPSWLCVSRLLKPYQRPSPKRQVVRVSWAFKAWGSTAKFARPTFSPFARRPPSMQSCIVVWDWLRRA